jgi:hypothetical protein
LHATTAPNAPLSPASGCHPSKDVVSTSEPDLNDPVTSRKPGQADQVIE